MARELPAPQHVSPICLANRALVAVQVSNLLPRDISDLKKSATPPTEQKRRLATTSISLIYVLITWEIAGVRLCFKPIPPQHGGLVDSGLANN